MPVTGKVLEDSIRLGKIRRIKLALYIVQTAILVALAFVMAFLMGGATITPDLYLPVPVFVAIVVLLLLVICLESFFFRILEIRFARSSSARHLMAKNSMKKAILIAAVSGLFAAILLVPAIVESMENAAETTEQLIRPFTPSMSFFSSDPLALMENGELEVTADRVVAVYLVTQENYDANSQNLGALYSLRLNKNNYQVPTDEPLLIDVPTNEYAQYVLVLDDWENQGTSARVTIVKTLSPIFTDIVSLLLLAMVVGNVAWIAYLIPIERKYSAGSIYK